MDPWLSALVGVVIATISSTGFWAWMSRRSTLSSATTRLIMGLAYHNIITLGMEYITRGSITKDEYEDFRKYFYEPYTQLGGNGVAERIMNDVSALQFETPRLYELGQLDRTREKVTGT